MCISWSVENGTIETYRSRVYVSMAVCYGMVFV